MEPDKDKAGAALPAVVTPNDATIELAWHTKSGFELAQSMAQKLCTSTLIPEVYRGVTNIGNVLVALELSQRIGASPLTVMQNLHIIKGRPSWASSFIIALINTSGRFSPLRFEHEGTGDGAKCRAMAWEYDDGKKVKINGPWVSIAMAKSEGWFGKEGSKWKTMPEVMLQYRAAAFFGRVYAPDLLAGLKTSDELEDMTPYEAPGRALADIISDEQNGNTQQAPAKIGDGKGKGKGKAGSKKEAAAPPNPPTQEPGKVVDAEVVPENSEQAPPPLVNPAKVQKDIF